MKTAEAMAAVLLLLGIASASSVAEPSTAPAVTEQPMRATEAIASGIDIEIARQTLRRHGYDKWDVPLSISSGNESIALDTCCIDQNITLILAFDKRTKRVARMSFHIEPTKPPVKGLGVQRDVLEMRFEKDGTYTVKLMGTPRDSKTGK